MLTAPAQIMNNTWTQKKAKADAEPLQARTEHMVNADLLTDYPRSSGWTSRGFWPASAQSQAEVISDSECKNLKSDSDLTDERR